MPGVGDPGLVCEDLLAQGVLDDSPSDGDLVDDPRKDVPGKFPTEDAIVDAPAEDDLEVDPL